MPKREFDYKLNIYDISTGETFSTTKWELLPIYDIAISILNDYDNYLSTIRSKTSEHPPPLIDVSYLYDFNSIPDNGNVVDDDSSIDPIPQIVTAQDVELPDYG